MYCVHVLLACIAQDWQLQRAKTMRAAQLLLYGSTARVFWAWKGAAKVRGQRGQAPGGNRSFHR